MFRNPCKAKGVGSDNCELNEAQETSTNCGLVQVQHMSCQLNSSVISNLNKKNLSSYGFGDREFYPVVDQIMTNLSIVGLELG